MRSSELATEAGVNVQTLRYYERRGLLPEPERLESGYRSYGPEAVRIVRFVKRAQQLGFSLDDVGSLLQLAGGGPESCGAARRLAAEKMAELDRKIEALGAMRESLSQLVATCDRPQARRECPLLQAYDTLFFPAVLGRSALVESSCQATGRPIRLEVAPDRVVSVHPPTTVVSQVHPGDTVDDLRGVVCRHGHFFSSPEAAADWASGHPEGVVLSVADAFERARLACEDLGWVARTAQNDQAGWSLRRPPMSEEARC